MAHSTAYSPGFFQKYQDGSVRSARVVVPILLDLFGPRSVLDVGCGIGTWLSVFADHGLDDLVGLDGPYVDRSMLRMAPDRFRQINLIEPVRLDRRFDLVMSVEVAEHLPATAADTFVESLTRHGSIVAFSAAVPFQGGTHHINEQWQSYWVERFRRAGYTCFDVLRPLLWDDLAVNFWYAQNMMLFVDSATLTADPDLGRRLAALPSMGNVAAVHPRLHLLRAAEPNLI
jgi:SAM-dependent methyltransferase